MLNKITLQNFQSHKNTEIELSEGVNAIVGNSDSGKSAIIRGLRWVIENKNDDSGFIRRGCKDVSVTLDFDDVTVIRSRDNSGNTYIIEDDNDEVHEFKAFKTEIPATVANAIHLSDINLQTQLEAPFLLSESAGEVAKTLNKMVNLSVVHESVNKVKKLVLDCNRSITDTEQQYNENEEAVGQFKYLAQFEKDVKAYELLDKELQDTIRAKSDLAKAISRYHDTTDKIDSFDELLDLEETVEFAVDKIKEVEAISKNVKSLVSILSEISKQTKLHEESCGLVFMETSVNESIAACKAIIELSDILNIADKEQNAITKIYDYLGEYEKEYINLMGVRCPLCENQLVDEIPY